MEPTDIPTPEPTPAAPAVFRVPVLSKVAAFADGSMADSDGNGRPIHALKVGTWTDSFGREATFTEADLVLMAERLNAMAAKRKPPITERHDYGRAYGRMVRAYTQRNNRDLMIVPKWNAAGRQMLMEEIYDMFSIEIDMSNGMTVIGGTLTNYPAVEGLRPITLEAPPLDHTPAPTEEVTPMAEEPTTPTTPAPAPAPAVAPPAPPLNLSDDPVAQQQLVAYQAQMAAYMREQHQQIMQQAQQQAQMEFERWRAAQAAEQAIAAFAQHATTPTIERPHALAYSVEQVTALLSGLSTDKRAAVQTLITDILDGKALVAYDAIGAPGNGNEDVAGQWQASVATFTAQGLSQSAAIQAAQRANPTLYQKYNALGKQRKGGR